MRATRVTTSGGATAPPFFYAGNAPKVALPSGRTFDNL